MIKITFFLLQVVFVSFVSNTIQFAFVPTMSTHSFIKINADAVGFHITHVLTKIHCQNFNDANDVVYKTFAVNCFFRRKLQHAALVCVRKFFEIYQRYEKKETTCKTYDNKRRQDDDNNENGNNDNG